VIGLTLVVTSDRLFITLFIVILFHQMFEGLALGSRIAALGKQDCQAQRIHMHSHAKFADSGEAEPSGPVAGAEAPSQVQPVTFGKKVALASLFSLISPIGMAIGMPLLNVFNGNDPATIIAISTLEAFSAGILVWVGVVEMWAEDWVLGRGGDAEFVKASNLTTTIGGIALVSGMAIMSALGKWV
jgi:solute carrier family 39 (zinc transporter), member 1/2/3